MKMSLKRKLGFVHVRGGRVLRVVTPHRVLTGTTNHYEKDLVRRETEAPLAKLASGRGYLFTQEGDLAVEIVAVKTDKVIGHSYLSGPALNFQSYDPKPDAWWREATLEAIDIPPPSGPGLTIEAAAEQLGPFFGEVKHQKTDVRAFLVRLPPKMTAESVGSVAEVFFRAWTVSPSTPEDRLHLIGAAHSKKGSGLMLHFQPPCDASNASLGRFQTMLVLSAARIDIGDLL